MRHVTGYTRKQDRQLFDKRRPWAPGKRPPTPPSTLYPGCNVRILSSAPQWAFGPNAPPVYPGHMPEPKPTEEQASTEPEPIQTGQPEDPSAPPNEIDKREEQLDLEENQTAPDISSAAEENEPVQAEQAQDEPTEDQPAQDEPTEEESRPEPIYLEDLDPHTQRVVYSALALPPEPGLGPKILEQPPADQPEPPAPDRARGNRKTPAPRRCQTQDLTVIRHEARCSICKHPERESIDQAILHWEPFTRIALEFNLGSRLAVYRHARTLQLSEQRASKSRHCLAQIMEHAGSVIPTAGDVIRAVRAFSCLDDTGRWTEPRREVLVTHQYAEPSGPNRPAGVQRPRQLPAPAGSSSQQERRPAWRRFFSRRQVRPAQSPNLAAFPARDLIDTHDEQNSHLTPTESDT